jgi:hypothetical protein
MNSSPAASPARCTLFFMNNSTIAIIAVSLIIVACQGLPNKDKGVYKEVGWTVHFPKNYNISDSLLIEKNNKNSSGYLKTLFAVRQNNYNSFVATVNPYESNEATWEESFEVSKRTMIDQIKFMGPNILTIDTSSTTELIDKLKFLKFNLVTFYSALNLTLNTSVYYRKIGNLDLVITLGFQDKEIGKEYKNILLKSQFEK